MQGLAVHERKTSGEDVEYRSHHRTFEYPKMPDAKDYVPKPYQPSTGAHTERFTPQQSYPAPPVPSRPAEYARLQPRPSGDSAGTHAHPTTHRPSPSGSPAPDPPRTTSSQNGTQTPPVESRAPEPSVRRSTGALLSMRVPAQVISQFLSLAQRNTSRRIETLGLLLGTERLQYGRIPQLVVEVLVVPQQTGTSDTCAMLSEEQVLAVSLERGLDCLGWVCPSPFFTRNEAE